MLEKIGRIILCNTIKNTGWIIEEGNYKEIYQFNLREIGGNIYFLYPKARKYHSLLEGHIIRFTIKNNKVTDINYLDFIDSYHQDCLEIASKKNLIEIQCECGNKMYNIHIHCLVCAVKKNQCIICGQPLSI